MFARHDTRCVRRSHGRRLCGDDTSIERLTDKCTRIVVCHFETHPLHEGIPKKYLHDITRRLPSDLDPNVAAEYLFDEFYWETRCSVLYPRQALLAEQHGLSWKQLFFEIHMQQHFEAFGGNDHVSFIVSLLCGGLLVRSGYAARDFDDFECVPRLHIHASCRTAAWTPRFISIAAEVAQHHDCQFDLWSQKSRDELRPDALWNEGKLSCLL
mmetsp:Transcript_9504/g.38787  ORF Transcript_9504/g.38787 Transcript_9504/m.38787 type:complete len:212 (+) Transcript_9504:158-793(+)